MVDSLLEKTKQVDFQVHILALDLVSEKFLIDNYKKNAKVIIYNLSEFDDEYVWNLRKSRSHREFCWGLSAVIANFVLEKTSQVTVYLDADIMFFSDPSVLIFDCNENSVAATPHRFPDRLKFQEINGIYNVQWVQFKFDDEGRAASKKWREQCERSSSYAPELGIVGDQKYLDTWHLENKSFKAISNVGAGLAPWNHEEFDLLEIDGTLYVSGTPLIFYHFHSFKIEDSGNITFANAIYGHEQPLPTSIYHAYLQKLAPLYDSLAEILTLPKTDIWKFPKNPSALRNFFGKMYVKISR